ncbi:MAG: GtrA family protein [Renibacterium salmoninarum]|nr:GtrA family protein [Renibacterium salmoninarum]
MSTPGGPAVRQLFRSSWRFAVVGLSSNLLGYLLFVGLSLLGASAFAALTASFLLSMVISYFGNRGFTFAHRGSWRKSGLKFLAVAAFAYCFNFGILWLFVQHWGMPQIVVQFFAVGAVALCTFTLMRLWVFPARAAAQLETDAQLETGA